MKDTLMTTYAIKNNRNLWLSIDDTWLSLEEGIRQDTIRGYTELDAVNEDLLKYQQDQATVAYHPWQMGKTRELQLT
jgi:hypothetical protein